MAQSNMLGWDSRLLRLLAASERKNAERQLDQLYLDWLSRVIERIVSEETGGDIAATQEQIGDEADIFDDVFLMVRGRIANHLLRLWEARRAGDYSHRPIGSLYAYVAAAARNACVDYLRREYPGRHALDNSLRAVLAKLPDLAIWKVPQNNGATQWRCGKTRWRDANTLPVSLQGSPTLLRRLSQELEGLRRDEALPRIFELVVRPLHYQEVLSFLSQEWDVERRYLLEAAERAPFYVPKAYQHIQPDDVVEIIGTLHSTWGQVRRLSQIQAAVLLLKAPPLDGAPFLDLMVRHKIADWSALEKTLGRPAEELRSMSGDLPLDDDTIAGIVGLPTEDIPRIRQDARRRMTRQNERRRRKQEELKRNGD